MKKTGILKAGAVLVAVAAAYSIGLWGNLDAPSRSVVRAGRVGFEPPRIDLGAQLWDTVLPFDLTFVNGGPGPVAIETISSSCDCILLDAESYRGLAVEAGASLNISGTLDTGKHGGSLVRTVTLSSASQKKYTADLFLDVFGTWSISTDALDFGEAVLGDPHSLDLEQSFTFLADSDQLVGEPECDAPWIRCFAAKRDAATTEILVRVLKDELPLGVNTADIVLRTTSPVRPDTSVYVRVRGVPALVATPMSVFLVGSEVKRVRVAARDGRPATLVRGESSTDQIRAHIVGPAEVEIANVGGAPLREAASVRIEDEQGRFAVIQVSAF